MPETIPLPCQQFILLRKKKTKQKTKRNAFLKKTFEENV